MKIFKKVSLLLLSLLIVSTACEDNYLDVNDDPNNPATATVELVLPAGMSSVAFTLGGQWQVLGSIWAQQWTQSTGANQYANVDNYNIDESSYNRQYVEMYAGALNDFEFVSKQAAANEDWNYFLIAEVMKAYTYQVLADFYDKIPYSEALLGTENTTPKFDNGQDIYDNLIVKLDAALAKDRSLSNVRTVGNEDVVFQGDMDNWVRFANTLKLKIYMRQSEARANVAQAGIQALFASGAQFLEADAEMAEFIDVQNYRNPFFATQISTDGNGRGYVDIAASNTLLQYLQDNADPRLDAIYDSPAAGGPQVGLDQGDYTNPGFATAKNLSQPAVTATTPVVFMSAAESKFLQAEAVVRYGVSGDAQELYEEGVEASFAKLGVSNASDYYGAGDVYEFPATQGDQIKFIITQKWVAFANFQGVEAYFEHLRTGYPDFFVATPNNVTGDIFPKRLPYPSTEQDNNGDNLTAAGGQRQVIERVWWDPS
ncbi:SusD/RagB family nutrient-binding outer membrane lipoprotein [Fulvivirga ligni]|uniref:SusD/RagB family nutrient-binding outer membrane lipoprotein n=1 Tax=Fulvivirga ligni TaxID=2904246 RepID=UPI001F3B78AF|nr:SusD/RagB family nutrient-binding outer membrane lipoprotein [Fulvivirga ligni]UII20183.1 SusD/RagB family nutrient-binding outer membrane lipoprotein [Fulvivirga ligni]